MGALDTVFAEAYAGDALAAPRRDLMSPLVTPSPSTGEGWRGGDEPIEEPAHFFESAAIEGLSRTFGVYVLRFRCGVTTVRDGPAGSEVQTRGGWHFGMTWAFSIDTGELTVIQGDYLQSARVAATASLAARAMARKDSAVLGMLGSGRLARYHAEAMKAVRPIRRIQVYSPTTEHREQYAREMSAALAVEVVPMASPAQAVHRADIVACCTNSVKPVLEAAWLAPGMFISTVQGSELDQEAWNRVDRLVDFAVGRVEGSASDELATSGRPIIYRAGKPDQYGRMLSARRTSSADDRGPPEAPRAPTRVHYRDLRAPGMLGRSSREQITALGSNHVQGLQFAAAAGRAVQLARERGVGSQVPTEVFLGEGAAS
jgi:hypothetical protein